jgi:hypothetical protein
MVALAAALTIDKFKAPKVGRAAHKLEDCRHSNYQSTLGFLENQPRSRSINAHKDCGGVASAEIEESDGRFVVVFHYFCIWNLI